MDKQVANDVAIGRINATSKLPYEDSNSPSSQSSRPSQTAARVRTARQKEDLSKNLKMDAFIFRAKSISSVCTQPRSQSTAVPTTATATATQQQTSSPRVKRNEAQTEVQKVKLNVSENRGKVSEVYTKYFSKESQETYQSKRRCVEELRLRSKEIEVEIVMKTGEVVTDGDDKGELDLDDLTPLLGSEKKKSMAEVLENIKVQVEELNRRAKDKVLRESRRNAVPAHKPEEEEDKTDCSSNAAKKSSRKRLRNELPGKENVEKKCQPQPTEKRAFVKARSRGCKRSKQAKVAE